MKKILEEFKAFALKGNMIDMAVAVIIGGAFNSLITSLVEKTIIFYSVLVVPVLPHKPLAKWGSFFLKAKSLRNSRSPNHSIGGISHER